MQKFLIKLLLVTLLSFEALCSLEILSPQKLASWWTDHPQETHTSIASFGHIPWGRKLMGKLALAQPKDACDYIRINDDAPHSPILVAQRGNCPFYLKAHYAQLAGARMLIIVDNQYEDVDSKLMVDSAGQGESIHIPSVLLSKQAGDKLIDSLETKDKAINQIGVLYDFSLPKGDKIEYHLWLTSAVSQTFRFLKDWKQYSDKLGLVSTMQPHFAHFSAYAGSPEDPNSENCFCGGRYCAADPDGEGEGNGKDVIREDLRQICILKTYGVNVWWDYVLAYDDQCAKSMLDCSQDATYGVGINIAEINQCVNESFDDNNANTCQNNKYLAAEEELMTEDGVFIFPSVTINGFLYRGNLIPAEGVFEAVCESFNKLPDVCVGQFDLDINTPRKVSHGPVIFAALAFLFLFGLFVFCCYRRYLKREMYKQMVRDVNIAVSQYIAFKDSEEKDLKGEEEI